MKIEVLSKAEQVRRAILAEILSGRLRPGERLLEAGLSKALGVSQATVNVALQDLHKQGLVTKLLNRSTNVSRYTLEDIERLFAVRVLLEPSAAAAVSAAWSANGQARLVAQVQAMRQAARSRDLAGFCMADYEFHQEIYRLSGNPFLAQASEAIAAAPFAYVLCDHLEALPTDYVALAEDHQEIVAAMALGPEQAARAARERIEKWLDHSRRALLDEAGGTSRRKTAGAASRKAGGRTAGATGERP
ncbi:MAG TPA: GntR family transcriptional regulator [Bryobacteraceae bacterium]|jgi:DNA-binding GntR family transcriptional regulator|nr:GntR family transcriptional regulator [Bryobacteraceae bacterium]